MKGGVLVQGRPWLSHDQEAEQHPRWSRYQLAYRQRIVRLVEAGRLTGVEAGALLCSVSKRFGKIVRFGARRIWKTPR